MVKIIKNREKIGSRGNVIREKIKEQKYLLKQRKWEKKGGYKTDFNYLLEWKQDPAA